MKSTHSVFNRWLVANYHNRDRYLLKRDGPVHCVIVPLAPYENWAPFDAKHVHSQMSVHATQIQTIRTEKNEECHVTTNIWEVQL